MSLKIGDEVTLGRYYQSSDNGKDPVQWIIIDENEDSFLLISQKILDARAFDSPNQTKRLITWKGSEIRRWLNGTFYNALLDESEKEIVQLHEYDVEENDAPLIPSYPEHKASPGGATPVGKSDVTEDYIALLSWEEAKKLPDNPPGKKKTEEIYRDLMKIFEFQKMDDVLLSKRYLSAPATVYAKEKMGPKNGKMTSPVYWLRSPGRTPYEIALCCKGRADREGVYYCDIYGVRPILWASKEELEKMEASRLEALKKKQEEERRIEEEKARQEEERRQEEIRRQEEEKALRKREEKKWQLQKVIYILVGILLSLVGICGMVGGTFIPGIWKEFELLLLVDGASAIAGIAGVVLLVKGIKM